MKNIFSEELIKGLLKTKKKYNADEKVDFSSIEDGVYEVKIDSVRVDITKSSNNVAVKIDSFTLDDGQMINSLFVLTKDTQAVNLQQLRNLLIYCEEEDFTEKELKNSEKFEKKLQNVVGHKVQLELKTSEKGFQSTSFVGSLDDEEDVDEDDDEDNDDDE